jgi:hypothetical protein
MTNETNVGDSLQPYGTRVQVMTLPSGALNERQSLVRPFLTLTAGNLVQNRNWNAELLFLDYLPRKIG